MKKLDIVHHKIILLALTILVLITGILFGVRISDASGALGLSIITFALVFLCTFVLFLLFLKITHISEALNAKKVKKMRKSRKGQAALEFISTYGWAILIVLVMIGALSFFGVTNPQRYLPDKCIFKVGLACDDFIVVDQGANMDLSFGVENGLGESITVHGATISHDGTRYLCTGGGGVIQSGENVSFSCTTITGNPGVDQSVKFAVNITYTPVNGNYLRIASGDISTRVQP